MKATSVDWITTNEGHVRSKIYDGALPPHRAYEDLLRLEKAQRQAERRQAEARYDALAAKYAKLWEEFTLLKPDLDETA